jgi:hypothetical protein
MTAEAVCKVPIVHKAEQCTRECTVLVQSDIAVRAFGAGDSFGPSRIFAVLHQVIEKKEVTTSGTVHARQAGQFP